MCADVSVIMSSYLLYYKNINRYDNSYQYLNKKSGCKNIFFRSEYCLWSAFQITEDQFMKVLKTTDFWEFVRTVIKLDLRHENLYLRQYGITFGIHAGLHVGIWLFQLRCSALQVGQRDKCQKNKLSFEIL